MSSATFTAAKMMWNQAIFARFPSEDASGNQNRDDFQFNGCSEAGLMAAITAQMNFESGQDFVSSGELALTIKGLDGKILDFSSVGNRAGKSNAKANQECDVSCMTDKISKAATNLSLGIRQDDLLRKMSCVKESLLGPSTPDCPGAAKPSAQQLTGYLVDTKTTLETMAVGGTDCHKAQLNINLALQ